jgi:alpha-beta hydrolase superfamily lysophospholipase
MFAHHTIVRDTSFFDEDLKASIAIVHGFGESSDFFIEPAIQFALNGFDCHLIDLRGYGFSAGVRCSSNKIYDYQYEVLTLLKQVNPNLPVFIYSHSMGALTVATFLMNNLNLRIQGVIFSAPFFGLHKRSNIDQNKKDMIGVIAPHLEVILELSFIL